MRKSALLATSSVAFGVAMMAIPGVASAAESTTYQATLNAINGSGAQGTLMIKVSGNQATVTEKASGLAATFNGQPYPHVQHIHGLAQGVCPPKSADKDGDGVISTVEGQPFYGGIQTTLTTSGDTSPKSATQLTVAPSGSTIDYKRTFELNADTMKALKSGNAVIVVHGLDPSKLPQAAQSKMSELVPSLPLAATSPALCGVVKASQMSSMPSGAAATGGGSTAGVENEGLLAAGAALVAAGAVTGGLALRRRSSASA